MAGNLHQHGPRKLRVRLFGDYRSRGARVIGNIPTSTSKRQRTSQPVAPLDTIARFSLGKKDVDAHSILMSKPVEDDTERDVDKATQLSVTKLSFQFIARTCLRRLVCGMIMFSACLLHVMCGRRVITRPY